MNLMSVFFAPMAFLIEHLWLIGIIAAGFVVFAFRFKAGGRVLKATAFLWVAYFCWEALVQYRSSHAAIGTDLLMIAPLLFILSAVTIAKMVKRHD